MKRYVCSICGYVYDEAKGAPDRGVAAGTPWASLSDVWVCPRCNAAKDAFSFAEQEGNPQRSVLPQTETVSDLRALPALEMHALFSNLARGCEKQYLAQAASWFGEIVDYFKAVSEPATSADYEQLLELSAFDLVNGIPAANEIAKAEGDRGALRALTWNEKVTRIHQSLLTRYARDGEAFVADTNVYVCTICGFIAIGDSPPELCPVCKVPSWKFDKVEGRG